MSYALGIDRSAQKSLARNAPPHRDRVIEAINSLSEDPWPAGALKLSGRTAWRIRVGNYRVIYEIDDTQAAVTVVVVGHRRQAYRD